MWLTFFRYQSKILWTDNSDSYHIEGKLWLDFKCSPHFDISWNRKKQITISTKFPKKKPGFGGLERCGQDNMMCSRNVIKCQIWKMVFYRGPKDLLAQQNWVDGLFFLISQEVFEKVILSTGLSGPVLSTTGSWGFDNTDYIFRKNSSHCWLSKRANYFR